MARRLKKKKLKEKTLERSSADSHGNWNRCGSFETNKKNRITKIVPILIVFRLNRSIICWCPLAIHHFLTKNPPSQTKQIPKNPSIGFRCRHCSRLLFIFFVLPLPFDCIDSKFKLIKLNYLPPVETKASGKITAWWKLFYFIFSERWLEKWMFWCRRRILLANIRFLEGRLGLSWGGVRMWGIRDD